MGPCWVNLSLYLCSVARTPPLRDLPPRDSEAVYFKFPSSYNEERVYATPMALFSDIETLSITSSTINVAFGDQHFSSASGASNFNASLTSCRSPTTSWPGIPIRIIPPTGKRALPRLTTMFTGREDIIGQLVRFFDRSQSSVGLGRQRIFVLYGLGGAGKTQITLKFVDEFFDLFSEVYYIDASRLETLQSGLEDIARMVSAGQTADDALHWLAQERKEWLLLLDNADDPNVNLRQFFPSCRHGNIIVTSRNTECRLHGPDSNCCVSGMKSDDATKLLLKYAMLEPSGENRATCLSIVRELGCLALAVAQAGAYIARSSCLNNYLQIYHNHRAELMRNNMVQTTDDYKWSVYTTWEMNLKKLTATAVRFLQLCSFLHYDGISLAIFQSAAAVEDVGSSFQDAVAFLQIFKSEDGQWSDFLFLETTNDLASYSLINVNAEGNMYSIHPLVHAWARDRMSSAERQAARTCTMQILALSASYQDGTESTIFRRTLLPHASQACAESISPDVAAKLQIVYWEGGRWAEAERLQKLVVESRKAELGDDHPDTLFSITTLALTYRDQGRWSEAEALQAEIIEAWRRVVGDNHRSMLNAINNLSLTYCSQGRWKEAETLQLEVLEARRKMLGEQHSDVLVVRSNLAWTYCQQGRLKEAEALQVDVLKASRSVLGDHHSVTLVDMNNLASTYCGQGRWEEASALQEEALEKRRKMFGDEHIDTLVVMNALALTYNRQGRWKQAESLQKEVMEARRKLLGPHHPNTLTTMHNLAWTYCQQNRWKEAEELQVGVLEVMKDLYSNEHPHKLATMNDLALTYVGQGRWKEAEALQMEVIDMKSNAFGNSHPATLTTMTNLASTYRQQGRLQEAEALGIEVMENMKMVLGDEHPETLATTNNLALTCSDRGRWKEAEVYQVSVMEATKRLHGNRHPNTLAIMNNLSLTYSRLGRLKEAAALQVEVLEGKRMLFGNGHPDTLAVMNDLALTYSQQASWKEAEILLVELMDCQRNLLTNEDQAILLTMNLLARTYSAQGCFNEAKVLLMEVMEVKKRSLGDEHPDTLIIMANLVTIYRDLAQWDEAEQLALKVVTARRRLFGDDHPNTKRIVDLFSEVQSLRKQELPSQVQTCHDHDE